MDAAQEIKQRHQAAAKLAANSLVVGLLAGLIVSLYRLLIPKISAVLLDLIHKAAGNPLKAFLIVLLMTAAGAAAAFMVKREPMIGGSGIPQVAGKLHGEFDLCWWRILLYKFLGGLLTLGGGLTMGREGPSVQIGASVAQGYCRVSKRSKSEERYLVASGAAAGLATAFSAPISGLIFALEEVHRSFTPLAMFSALTAALAANYVSVFFFGVTPVLSAIPQLPHMNVRIYWMLIILGIIAGLSGVLFNFLIVKGKAFYAKLPVPSFVKPIIPFVLTALAVLWRPELFGSGEPFIFLPLGDNLPIGKLALIYIAKLILLLAAFCSGLPGGIFFPLLILGSLVGNIFGSICASAGLIEPDWIVIFAVLAMSAHFAAIVRSPVTGMLLLVEMTGSFSYLLPLGLVSLMAYFTAEFMHSEPVYESLLDIILKNKKKENTATQHVTRLNPSESLSREKERLDETEQGRPDLLVEFSVNPGCKADGALISELGLPDPLLLISVKRANEEILPKGKIRLRSGDILVGLLNHKNLAEIQKIMDRLLVGEVSTK